jgi:hypothetical protein
MSSRVSSTLVGFHRTSKRLGFSASGSGFLERHFSEEKRDRELERGVFWVWQVQESEPTMCLGSSAGKSTLGNALSSVKRHEDS